MRDPLDLPKSWKELELTDLVIAYRKAKVDCFYERAVSQRLEFARYEENLEAHLSLLLRDLRQETSRNNLFDRDDLLGTWHLVPKKLIVEPRDRGAKVHPTAVHRSDKQEAFRAACVEKKVGVDARLTSRFTIDLHVLSSLWVNLVGQRLDAFLGDWAYGSRVRRLPVAANRQSGAYPLWSNGTFPPFVWPYRRWREDGIRAMRSSLEQGKSVIALTMDFNSYFHSINPAFIDTDSFYETLEKDSGRQARDTLHNLCDGFGRDFTRLLVRFLRKWQTRANEKLGFDSHGEMVGIPIAMSAARVMANVLLLEWDRAIMRNLVPIHYGRYVDDLMLVLHDPGHLNSIESVLQFMKERLPRGMIVLAPSNVAGSPASIRDIEWRVCLKPYHANVLKLKRSKQRLFFLSGSAGLDILRVVEKDVQTLASERRMMPVPRLLTDGLAPDLLAATVDPGEMPDTLRKSDGLSLRRLGWSIRLKHAETLQGDLPPEEWIQQRSDLYKFASAHVITPARILDYWDYMPRLLTIAVSCRDWQQAIDLYTESVESLKAIKKGCPKHEPLDRVNGGSVAVDWNLLHATLEHQAWEAIVAAWPTDPEAGTKERALRLAALFKQRRAPSEAAQSVKSSDLGVQPWKASLANGQSGDGALQVQRKSQIAKCFKEESLDLIQDFLHRSSSRKGKSIPLPILFPTRPLTPSEITEYDPRCIDPEFGENEHAFSGHWRRLILTLCGYSIGDMSDRPHTVGEANQNGVVVVSLGKQRPDWKPRLGLSSYEVKPESWNAAAAGKPNLSHQRYEQVANIVNLALQAKPRPDYLLLPELSLPIRWRHSVANKLLASGINLIAGLEYENEGKYRVRNQAFLALQDDRFGFPIVAFLRQDKRLPAGKEEEDLLRLHGKKLKSQPLLKERVYQHQGFQFGILLCSELQDISRRAIFRGSADALLVLSWNQDLDTFESLVEAAALDVHAYIGLVNNRLFGGSRLRAPAKQRYARDICRVRGGSNDYLVVAEVDYHALRKFQSRAKAWAREGDLFKPVPTGFRIADLRRAIP